MKIWGNISKKYKRKSFFTFQRFLFEQYLSGTEPCNLVLYQNPDTRKNLVEDHFAFHISNLLFRCSSSIDLMAIHLINDLTINFRIYNSFCLPVKVLYFGSKAFFPPPSCHSIPKNE